MMFQVLVGQWYISFGEMSIYVLCPFSNQAALLSLSLRVPYIFRILTPHQVYDFYISSPILWVFLIFLITLFAMQILFIFMASAYLFFFSFIICAFGVISKKPLPIHGHEGLLLCFLRDFIILALRFKSIIRTMLTFAHGMMERYHFFFFFFCVCCIQLSQRHLLKRLFFCP